MKDKIWDVVIIGSGPAGLTAGIYTTRGAVSTIIFGGEIWGGQLMLTSIVDNFPGFPDGIMGPTLMENMKKQAIRFGANFVPSNVTSVEIDSSPFKITTSDSSILTKTIIIATGAETKWLGVPGEKELIGRGISSCAPCDAPFFKEKDVLVVGGGDSAMEEALVLTKYATKVTIIHRKPKFRASKAMQEKILNNSKINIVWNTEVLEVIGKEKFEGLKIKDIVSGIISEIRADGLFVAIGHTPSSQIFKDKLELDEKGYIKVYEGSKTNIPGIFVSGDVHDHTYKQAVTAAGFGCQAALDTLNYLVDKS